MASTIDFPARLHDRTGHAYRIAFACSREFWTIRVWDGHRPAAYLYAWHVRGHRLRIQDFKVADDVRLPEQPLLGLLRNLLRLSPRTMSYRGRGIGTALLAAVVNYTQAKGIPRIEGEIIARDQAQFPGLPDWYHDRGFTLRRDAEGLRFHRDLSLQPNAAASNL